VHAAGVVISPQPLTDLVPLFRTKNDEIVTAFDMTAIEKMGLLKMDFLGLTTLTIIDDCLKLIAHNRGASLDMKDVPLDDPKTYEEVFHKGLTSGVFQFESHGMRDVLRRYRPTALADLTALNALYRPGPIQGGMIDDFIDRKHGRKRVEYELPQLKDVLEETLGVIVYQEQVMQIANRLAGYSLGEADLLRRAMGKKKPEEMAAQRERFIKGALERNFPQRKIEKIFDLMEQFAGYGFNKSHSAAYALVAYHTAFLKTHYPVEFMAALLTSQTGNTDSVVKYINEGRLHSPRRCHPLRAGGGQERRPQCHRIHHRGAHGTRTIPVVLPVLREGGPAAHEPQGHRIPYQVGRHGFSRPPLPAHGGDRQGHRTGTKVATRRRIRPARPLHLLRRHPRAAAGR
jgi:DNA polymerase-3 subunit alpha